MGEGDRLLTDRFVLDINLDVRSIISLGGCDILSRSYTISTVII